MSRQKRNKEAADITTKLNMELKQIRPLTETQKEVFESKDSHLLLTGVAGTGKTFLAMHQAYEDILQDHRYYQLVIIRSVVETRKMGFLPGNDKAKAAIYERPYEAITNELFNRGDAYQYLKQKNIVEFESTSFLRGQTLDNSVVIVDEFQNMTAHEIDTVVTRMGKNTRIIVAGDCRQDDLKQNRERSGAADFIKIAESMGRFKSIEFGFDDIVRSNFVKQYIIARHRLEQSKAITPL